MPMNFADERWVKLYTRDTASWLALSWMARSVFMHLLRKCDRAGQVDLGRAGLRGLIGLIGGAEYRADIERAVRELADDGAIELSSDESRITLPRFVDAQESRMSARARAKASRDRKAVTKRDASVTPRDGDSNDEHVTKRDGSVTGRDGSVTDRDNDPSSQNVTAASQGVTAASRNHAFRDSRLPNRIEQNRREGGERARDAHAPAPARARAREETPPAPTLTESQTALLEALEDGAERTDGRWVEAGEPWQRAALAVELERRSVDVREASIVGRYLASSTAIEQERSWPFSVDWFVFGTPDAPEFKRLDGVLTRARQWDARRSSVPAQSSPLPPRVEKTEEQKAPNRASARKLVANLLASQGPGEPLAAAESLAMDRLPEDGS